MNTEPALAPPGWLARRQRTISSMAALPAAGSPARSRWVAGHHHVGGGQRGVAVGGGERRPPDGRATDARGQIDDPVARRAWRSCRSRDRRRSSAPPRRPCRAPPRPTRSPVRPAAAVRRASVGRASPAPRRGRRCPSITSDVEARARA